MLKIGCCGFPKRMEEYFKRFRLVEIQKTFYSLPKVETALAWRAHAPDEFEFSVKVLQFITHSPDSPTYRRARISIPDYEKDSYGYFKPTDEVFGAWERTREVLNALKARIAVFQCPPSFRPTTENIKNMENFFRTIDRGDMLLVWEPRGEWGVKLVKKLCEKLEMIHCVDPLFESRAHESKTAYFRLHGSHIGRRVEYHHRYSIDELRKLLEICEGLKAKDVYCLFNNVYMLENAMELERLAKDII